MGIMALTAQSLYRQDAQGSWYQGQASAAAFIQPSGLVHGKAAVEEYQRLCSR